MTTAPRGLSWDNKGGKGAVRLAVLALFSTVLAPVPAAASTADVIVRETNPATATAQQLVERLGGTVGEHLDLIGGFTATIPAGVLDDLNADPSVYSVTSNATLRPSWGSRDHDWGDWGGWGGSDPGITLDLVANTIDADDYWRSGFTGQGVDVALIDTGVSPTYGLKTSGKIVNGADLSFDSQNPDLRYLDGNGHGTHMAGIIAGYEPYSWKGIAYGSRLVNVKVGSHDGSVDVSQVIAAIDWVIQHKNDNGMNIRVLNLSYGAEALQDSSVDPLSYAVEQAWKHGIVVVVAAGNAGPGAPLNNPATNPYVIATGATNTNGTTSRTDDTVADYTSCGIGRTVDLVAPGTSIESLRVPNSLADVEHADARVGSNHFKGSGTSQAAAVISGAAALIINQRPGISPDQVKALLTQSADWIEGADATCQGAGQVDLDQAEYMSTPDSVQSHAPATGLGSLEAARGGSHVSMEIPEASDDVLGPVHRWDLEGDAADSAGTATGSVYGANPVTGNSGQALSFDESNDRVQIPDFAYTTDFTVSFDFKVDSNYGSYFQYLYSHGDHTRANNLQVTLTESRQNEPNILRTNIQDGNDSFDARALDIDARGLIGDGQWHTYTLTVASGEGSKVYIDGVLKASSSQGGDSFDPRTDLFLGARHDLNGSRFYGEELDTVQIFDVALTAEQAADVAAGREPAGSSTMVEVELNGEQDIHGQPWDGTSWTQASASGTSWTGGEWNGTSWTGTSWTGTSWTGTSWTGTSWTGVSWTGVSWTDNTWNGTSWTGTSWTGVSWTGVSWTGSVWHGQSWG